MVAFALEIILLLFFRGCFESMNEGGVDVLLDRLGRAANKRLEFPAMGIHKDVRFNVVEQLNDPFDLPQRNPKCFEGFGRCLFGHLDKLDGAAKFRRVQGGDFILGEVVAHHVDDLVAETGVEDGRRQCRTDVRDGRRQLSRVPVDWPALEKN